MRVSIISCGLHLLNLDRVAMKPNKFITSILDKVSDLGPLITNLRQSDLLPQSPRNIADIAPSGFRLKIRSPVI
jgi:hypothetical protein